MVICQLTKQDCSKTPFQSPLDQYNNCSGKVEINTVTVTL